MHIFHFNSYVFKPDAHQIQTLGCSVKYFLSLRKI